MWQDVYSGKRGHKLVTKALGEKLPPMGTYADEGSFEKIPVPLKLFSPPTGWTWYIYEWEADTGLCMGLVEGYETEFGYIDLNELAELTLMGGMLTVVERDLHWRTTDLATVCDMVGIGWHR